MPKAKTDTTKAVTVISQLPKEIVASLSKDQQAQLTELLQQGHEVGVINGKLYLNKKLEGGEITAWSAGEKLVGQIIDIKESTRYPSNYLATILQGNGKQVVKPLNAVLYGRIKPHLKQLELAIFTIECLGLIEGEKFTYFDYDVSVALPIFAV